MTVEDEEMDVELFQPLEESRTIQATAVQEPDDGRRRVRFTSPLAEVMLFDYRLPVDTPLICLRHIASIGLIDHLLDEGEIDPLDLDSFAEALLEEKGFDDVKMRRLKGLTTTKKRKGFVTAEKLSENWSISIETARRTVEATTQMAVRDFTDTSGGRRLKPTHHF